MEVVVITTPEDLWLLIRRKWYRLWDVVYHNWCGACETSWPSLIHTCSGRHLYPIHRNGDTIVEFGVPHTTRANKAGMIVRTKGQSHEPETK